MNIENDEILKELKKEYFTLLQTEVIGKTKSLTIRIDKLEKNIRKRIKELTATPFEDESAIS